MHGCKNMRQDVYRSIGNGYICDVSHKKRCVFYLLCGSFYRVFAQIERESVVGAFCNGLREISLSAAGIEHRSEDKRTQCLTQAFVIVFSEKVSPGCNHFGIVSATRTVACQQVDISLFCNVENVPLFADKTLFRFFQRLSANGADKNFTHFRLFLFSRSRRSFSRRISTWANWIFANSYIRREQSLS